MRRTVRWKLYSKKIHFRLYTYIYIQLCHISHQVVYFITDHKSENHVYEQCDKTFCAISITLYLFTFLSMKPPHNSLDPSLCTSLTYVHISIITVTLHYAKKKKIKITHSDVSANWLVTNLTCNVNCHWHELPSASQPFH